jgi:hypothetical protein
MKYLVYRDQAVWEREYLEVTIPDGTPGSEVEEAVDEALDRGDYVSVCDPQIQDSVEGFDIIITVVQEN